MFNKPLHILKGHGYHQKKDVVYNEPKNIQGVLRGPPTPKKQEKPTNPNANHEGLNNRIT